MAWYQADNLQLISLDGRDIVMTRDVNTKLHYVYIMDHGEKCFTLLKGVNYFDALRFANRFAEVLDSGAQVVRWDELLDKDEED